MMLPAFATIDELDDRLPGGVGAADLPRALAALADASSKVRAEGRPWVTTEGVLDLPTGVNAWRADIIKRITLAATIRALTNPEGVTQQALGAYSETIANASPDVYLTAQERRDIQRAAGMGGIGAIAMSRGRLETARYGPGDTRYVDVDPPGEQIPWLADEVGY